MATLRTTLLMAALLVVPALAAADLWRYETESGAIAFTDELERIPARYAPSAVQLEERSLADYERTSVSVPGASIASARTSIDLEALEPKTGGVAAVALEKPRGDRLSIEVYDGIRLDIDADSDEPIYVDRGQYRTRNGIMSPHTIVSKGGKPLVVIDERP